VPVGTDDAAARARRLVRVLTPWIIFLFF
jgi:hypothetical protein